METAVSYKQPMFLTMQLEDGYSEREVLRAMRMIRGVAKIRKASTRKSRTNVITPELAASIAEARAEFQRGECVTCRTHEELDAYFATL